MSVTGRLRLALPIARAYVANSGTAAAIVLYAVALVAGARGEGLLEHLGPIEVSPPVDTRAIAPIVTGSAAPLLMVTSKARWSMAWSGRHRALRAFLAFAGPVIAWLVVYLSGGLTESPMGGLAFTAAVLAALAVATAVATNSVLAMLIPTSIAAVAFFWRASARTSHGPLGVFFGEHQSSTWAVIAAALTVAVAAGAHAWRPPDALGELVSRAAQPTTQHGVGRDTPVPKVM